MKEIEDSQSAKEIKRQSMEVETVDDDSQEEPYHEETRVGEILYSESNQEVKIISELDKYADIPVYEAECLNKTYIMKWYTSNVCKDLGLLRKRISVLLNNKNLNKGFIKPMIITQTNDKGEFGCLYNNLQNDFYAFKEVLKGYTFQYDGEILKRKSIKFKNLDVLLESAINIVKIFRTTIDIRRYFYALYDNSIIINIQTGEVLLDIVSCTAQVENVLIVKKDNTYIAPEVLKGEDNPNKQSDLYTLAVLLFKLFFHDHPLEGRAVVSENTLNKEYIMRHYKEKPVFILDPSNDINRPVRGVHYTIISMWKKYPNYLKNMFMKTFCEYIFIKEDRYTVTDWLKVLLRLKSDVLRCVCGKEDFSFMLGTTREGYYVCKHCGSKYHSLYFTNQDFSIPICQGTLLYKAFFKNTNIVTTEAIGEVIENKIHKDLYGIKNIGEKTWQCYTNKGENKSIKQGEVLPIFNGSVINAYDNTAHFDFTSPMEK